MATAYPELKQYIDGAWVHGGSTTTHPVLNPADEKVIAHYREADAADLERAITAAHNGFLAWRTIPLQERTAILLRCADLIRQRADHLAQILCAEGGKRLAEARWEVLRAADFIEWDAHEARRLYGRVLPSDSGIQHVTVREPIGPVAALIAWNFPASFLARKVGGALAAGCSVILKASEETPGTCVALVQCFVDAGIPAGAANLVLGDPPMISERLIRHPAVRAVSFTGSAEVGRIVAGLAAAELKPCVMELGGHAPVIVCADADLQRVVTASITAKFANNAGQVCVAPTRFIVHQSLYEDFVDALTAAAKNIRVGAGTDPDTDMGPLINQRRVDAIDALVTDAVRTGGRLTAGGHRLEGSGYFYAPTVIADVPEQAMAMCEEPFGPIALIASFAELDEAIDTANSLPYALAAYAFTESAQAAGRLTERVECGVLSINHIGAVPTSAPFGGIKGSGYGKEGGIEGLQAYTTLKYVSHQWA
ncbi:NAD-dependent succinate-semialdehyde dehydrogenase [Rhodococcus pseudokoreensis]|uniref:NAD-dependent succinate-semialdehyde dehydrogenase n=1 Tax=Rhodococcus pseudokoreensis TaxID=2811421 RepID=A0A974WAJ4_9NOCA|nr:NAD-dependent succinate-semialdehyde dehydrogenase [Rhodococcus pseudokoreensis]QSE93757.1 NAD-dependent succinate-semialdehyde dehydrogenase [Rhodococcus pseudokoreensis]